MLTVLYHSNIYLLPDKCARLKRNSNYLINFLKVSKLNAITKEKQK